MLKENGFNDVLSGQKLCRQCVTKYEKLSKPPENENMTELLRQRVHKTNYHQMIIFYCMNKQNMFHMFHMFRTQKLKDLLQ